MPIIHATHQAPAPPERVFEVYSDIERAADRIGAIIAVEKITPGPVQLGTRFRETRVVFKREHTEEMEFVELQPGQTYTLRAFSCGAEYRTRFDFRAEGSGTRVDVTMTISPKTVAAKLFSPLSLLMKKTIRKCLEDDMKNLDKAFESSSEAAVGA